MGMDTSSLGDPMYGGKLDALSNSISFSNFTKEFDSSMNVKRSETVVDFKKVKSNSKWGVIPYRLLASGKIEVLIISTRRKNWSLPKGNLIKNIGPQRTALLEAYEEAGIDGILQPNPILCSIGRTCIYFFPMEVTKEYQDWPEADCRNRKWIQITKARNMLHHRSMGKILTKFFSQKN
jgi:ADP-ribose pyrophosphatase YjhB (NUDIX family)